MADIVLKYTFGLENDETHNISIKDIKENVTEAEILKIANSLIEKQAAHKGIKFTSLIKCEKIITNKELIIKN